MAPRKRTKPKPPEIREIAAAGSGVAAQTAGFTNQLLQTGDSILKTRGGNQKIYRDVLRDDQVQSTLQQRRGAMISREWHVEPGGAAAIDRKAADALEENLKAIRWDTINKKMHYGIFYGFAVGECMWALDGGRIVLEDIKVRDRGRFRFDTERRLRLVSLSRPEGVVMPDRKFWTFSVGADNDDEPYGIGLAHWLFWPVFFKRNDLKFWLIFLDKFGAPTTQGHYPRGATPPEQKKLLDAALAVAQEAAIILPEGFEITLLEAARSGTSDYKSMLEEMNGAISKVVLSQTMTTDSGSSLSQAQVHEGVRDDVVKDDCDIQCESFNCGPAVWLTDWNFPGAKVPKVWRRIEDEPDLKPVAERDKLIYDMGYDPSPEYIKGTYGEGWERRKQAPGNDPPPAGAAPQQPAFAEHLHDDDSIDELTDAVTAEWEELTGPIIEPIRELFARAQDFDELKDGLAELIPDMDSARLGEVIARAGFKARMAANVEAPITDGER